MNILKRVSSPKALGFLMGIGINLLGFTQASGVIQFSDTWYLSTLTGNNGFTIEGLAFLDRSGSSVSSAGDINGDGFDDVIIGASLSGVNGADSGQAYVVFGSSSSLGQSLPASTLNGANGFLINGLAANQLAGFSVSKAGDVNGDGLDDIIIGAPEGNPMGINNAGQSYVIFGNSNGFTSPFELSTLDGNNGFTINGIVASDNSGHSVSGAGDVNGDGIDDIIIGAPAANPNGDADGGQSYVIFGDNNFLADFDLSSLNGANGFTLNGIDPADRAGTSVSGAGDVNGDEIGDIIIGAQFADPNGNESGESYVVFGDNGGFGAVLDLDTLNGVNGFIINGIAMDDRSGFSVSDAGDVNGDGFDDVIIGAPRAAASGQEDAGQGYVIFGRNGGFVSPLDVNTLNGVNGFTINGVVANDEAGTCVSSLGDFNDDGIDDLIIGVPYGDYPLSDSGGSYVIFGKTNGFGASVNLSNVSGDSGFLIIGREVGNYTGISVSGAGDFNGDGVADLILGAHYAEGEQDQAGQSYVLFSRSPVTDFTGDGLNDLIIAKPKGALGIVPLTISNEVVGPLLSPGTDLELPSELSPKKSKLKVITRVDAGGTPDVVIQRKNKLTVFQLENGLEGQAPQIAGQFDYTIPKKHKFVGIGPVVGDDTLGDIVLKQRKSIVFALNEGNSFNISTNGLAGKIKGNVLTVEKERMLVTKGRSLFSIPLDFSNGALGEREELGKIKKKFKIVAYTDVDADGFNEIIVTRKKREVGYLELSNLTAEPTEIVINAKKTKVVGPN